MGIPSSRAKPAMRHECRGPPVSPAPKTVVEQSQRPQPSDDPKAPETD
jgi:hypothetical protein